jgi:hypothetical protein
VERRLVSLLVAEVLVVLVVVDLEVLALVRQDLVQHLLAAVAVTAALLMGLAAVLGAVLGGTEQEALGQVDRAIMAVRQVPDHPMRLLVVVVLEVLAALLQIIVPAVMAAPEALG